LDGLGVEVEMMPDGSVKLTPGELADVIEAKLNRLDSLEGNLYEAERATLETFMFEAAPAIIYALRLADAESV